MKLFKRLACAFTNHQWHIDVKPEQGEFSVVLIIDERCKRCNEFIGVRFEISPEAMAAMRPSVN